VNYSPEQMSAEELISEARRQGWGLYFVGESPTLAYSPQNEPTVGFSAAWNRKAPDIAALLRLEDEAEWAADPARGWQGVSCFERPPNASAR
jgi:hypothetical protein